MNKGLSSLILSASLLLLLTGCADETQGYPVDYAYTVQLKCFCYPTGPFDIEIRNGEIVSFDSEQEINGDQEDELKEFLHLTSLSSRTNELLSEDHDEARIDYHPIFDFPTDVYIDIDFGIADEEWAYCITNFKEL